jgi:acetyltransferase
MPLARGAEQLQVGVARYVMTDPSTANVAIVVADEWQRKGIGKRLFEMLIDAARARGITRLEGEVLAENHAASALVKAFGFELSPSGVGDDLVVVEKKLA